MPISFTPISFTNDSRQRFRRRYDDVTIRGRVDPDAMPLRAAAWRLNGAPPQPLYVEATSDAGVDWVNGYKDTPAELRCRDQGEFCVEIPVTSEALREGFNDLAVEIESRCGSHARVAISFSWDSSRVPLPLDLSDLTRFSDIQEIGQVVNGSFELDRARNVIRSVAPVAPDALLVLGSAHGSQEATYAVRFLGTAGAKWLGLSDFFVRLEEGSPPRGIRVGWSSAGMAALSPNQQARSFLAWGDHSAREEEWAVVTHPPAPVAVEAGAFYRVRHQVTFANGVDRVRYRLWRAGEPEPMGWLCEEQDSAVPPHLPRHRAASFGLFQHLGPSVEWSDIRVVPFQPAADDMPRNDPAAGRTPFLERYRPGAF
jgi:hypothetical protein